MKTLTFYSYKGGVGRSLALVNIATRLVEFGKSVCLLDFDLEAPGLNLKFNDTGKLSISKGIVDYIHDFSNNGILNKGIADYALPITITENQRKSSFLIPAGNIDSKTYWKKLSAINWYEMLYENKDGLAFFLDLKEKIASQLKPDFLLVDSRTGISEISGVTLSLLAEEIVVLAANNQENLEGISKIIKGIKNSQHLLFGTNPTITFVLSRIPFTEKPEDKAKELALINTIKVNYLKDLIDEVNIIHSDRELELKEKIKIGYDKTDTSVPQIARDYLLLFEKLTRDCLSAEEVQKFNNLKKADQYWNRLLSSDINESQKLDLLNKAIELTPENPGFIAYRIQLYEEMGKMDQALKEAIRFKKMQPALPLSHLLLGDVYSRTRRHRESMEEYKKAISLDPSDFFANMGLALSYVRTGQYDAAIEIYGQLLITVPQNPLVYNGLANTYRLKGAYDLALHYIYQALTLNPKLFIAIATLAEIKAAQEWDEEFFIHFERAIISAMEVPQGKAYMEESVSQEAIYKQYEQHARFLAILEKYSFNYPLEETT